MDNIKLKTIFILTENIDKIGLFVNVYTYSTHSIP